MKLEKVKGRKKGEEGERGEVSHTSWLAIRRSLVVALLALIFASNDVRALTAYPFEGTSA